MKDMTLTTLHWRLSEAIDAYLSGENKDWSIVADLEREIAELEAELGIEREDAVPTEEEDDGVDLEAEVTKYGHRKEYA